MSTTERGHEHVSDPASGGGVEVLAAGGSSSPSSASTPRVFNPETVPGWLSPREGRLLHTLAKACSQRGAIVEIGSYLGKSTIFLALGARAGGGARVYAIDPHTGSPEHRTGPNPVWTFDAFMGNLHSAGVQDQVVPLVMSSTDAARGFPAPVELLFIDGNHAWESVRQDFDAWFPHVAGGGVIALHDTIKWAGPRRVAREQIFLSRRFSRASLLDSITFAWKVERNTGAARLRNRSVLYLKGAAAPGHTAALRKPAKWLLHLHCRLALRSHLHAPWRRTLGDLLLDPET